jgi:hypothetical protein
MTSERAEITEEMSLSFTWRAILKRRQVVPPSLVSGLMLRNTEHGPAAPEQAILRPRSRATEQVKEQVTDEPAVYRRRYINREWNRLPSQSNRSFLAPSPHRHDHSSSIQL